MDYIGDFDCSHNDEVTLFLTYILHFLSEAYIITIFI